MPIISKRNKRNRNDRKFIGVYIPTEMFSFLSLYCMAYSITKTSVISDLIINWKNQIIENNKDETLIELIAQHGIKAWKNRPLKKRNFLMFSNALRVELKNKGIKPEYVDKILNIVQNEKDKNN